MAKILIKLKDGQILNIPCHPDIRIQDQVGDAAFMMQMDMADVVGYFILQDGHVVDELQLVERMVA